MRLLPVLLSVLIIAAPLSAQAATPSSQPGSRVGIAATVNDDVVTLVDLDSRVKLYLGGNPRKPSPEELSRLQKEVLERLIDEKLQMQEAKALSIEIPDEQIAQGFAEIARQNQTSAEEFRDRLQDAGVRLDTLRDQIRAEIAWSQVVRRKLRPQINVSEQEIDNAMQQRNRSAGKTEYHLAEIFLTTNESNAESVTKEANDIYEALKKGARFSEIARARSQNPGANQGGDIGWLNSDQVDPALRSHLANMQTGQVSPPIKTEKGIYILFLRDQRQGGIPTDTAAPQAAQPAPVVDSEPVLALKQLTIPVAATEPQTVLAAKMARAQALASEVKGCDALDAIASEFNTQTAGGPQKMSTLPAPIAAVMQGLEDGALSKPIRTTNGVSVFMICSRTAPAPAPVAAAETAEAAPVADTTAEPAPGTSSEDTAREKIANEIGGTRLSQMQERYLRDLRATAFIERRI